MKNHAIMLTKVVMVDEDMNWLISLTNCIGKSNIDALVDMTTPSTIGQLEKLGQNVPPMEEILAKFHPICSLDQLIVDFEIELEHTLEINRSTMLINNLPAQTQQTFTRFGDWIYPPMHACNAFNVDPFMEPTRYLDELSIFHKHENGRWLWRMK
jgi:hypothetical protein